MYIFICEIFNGMAQDLKRAARLRADAAAAQRPRRRNRRHLSRKGNKTIRR